MTIKRVVPNISTVCLEASVQFYTDFLGFEVAMDLDWIITLCSPSNRTAQISLLRSEQETASTKHISISIEVADVDSLYEAAVDAGHPIPYPLTTEPWGVRRFQVLDPNGVTINVMKHDG